MQKIKACFFVATPFQIFSAISLAYSKSIDGDIYIIKRFNNAEEIANRLRKEKLFRKVKCIDIGEIESYRKYLNKSKLKFRINKFITYLRINSIVEELLIPNTVYETMYYSAADFTIMLVQAYFFKHKTGTKIVYFDDGDGTYNADVVSSGKLNMLVRRIVFGANCVDNNHPIFVYSPTIYNKMKNKTAYQLPHPKSNEKIRTIIRNVFMYTPEKIPSQNVIVLDTLKNIALSTDDAEKLEQLYDLIVSIFGNKNVIVKRHPRDKQPERQDRTYYRFNEYPFECICFDMEKIENKLLIAYSSTAIVTPKLLFDQEPYVILLYKMFPIKSSYMSEETYRRYYELVFSEYRELGKTFIPSSEKELKNVLESIRLKLIEGG